MFLFTIVFAAAKYFLLMLKQAQMTWWKISSMISIFDIITGFGSYLQDIPLDKHYDKAAQILLLTFSL